MEWDAKIPSPWDWPAPAPPQPQSESSSIGLKLGKRTYFEDAGMGGVGGGGAQSPSPAPLKKSKTAPQLLAAPNSRCQVEGCNADLTAAKDYHRKHRVCGHHSKSPKVIVAGQERRFCQQCSRFHELAEFDQKKRSCRRRLSDHNARRRKPQPDALSFNPSRASLSFYEDRQQLNFLWNRVPFGQLRPTTNSTWEGSSDFKLTQTNGSWMKSEKTGTFGGQIHLPSTGISSNASTLHDLDRFLRFKGTTAEVLNQGLEASAVASNLDGAPDLRRALSLLSTDSRGSAIPDLRPASLVNFSTKSHDGAPQSAVHPGSTNLEYWQEEQPLPQQAHSLSFNLHSNGSQFQQFQVLKAPFEASLFDSSQIH